MITHETVAIKKKLITTYTTPRGVSIIVESHDVDYRFPLSKIDESYVEYILENEEHLLANQKREAE